MIELTIDLSYAERLKAEIAVISGNLLALLWLALFPACGAVLLVLTYPRSDWLDLTIATLCFAFVPVALLAGAYRRYVLARKNGPFAYRLSPAGFELQTRTIELKLTWAGVPRVRTRLGFLLVYGSKGWAYPLPLRMLDPQQVESAFAWAKAGGARRIDI